MTKLAADCIRVDSLADGTSTFALRPRESTALPAVLLGAGFLLRLAWARLTFLNGDEALHYSISVRPSLALTYKESLTTAHPPLLLVFLHYWSRIGNSELLLRLPSVLVGTAFCLLVFLWLKRVLDRGVAIIALSLLLFAPPMIWLSAEVRQYALLWFFGAASLLFLELGVSERRKGMMLLSSLSLYLALLCHYSSFIIAAVFGVYGIVRIRYAKSPAGVAGVWVAGQMGALALMVWLLRNQVSKLKAVGMPQWISDGYLRRSVFHPGIDKTIPFVLGATFRFFHYLFAQTAAGALGPLFFGTGILLLIRNRRSKTDPNRPSGLALALLLVLPFIINCGLALAAVYPYGGSRHDSYLAMFAMPAIAVALARWPVSRGWMKPVAIATALGFCNLFPSPLGEYIEPRNQSRALMVDAADFLRHSVPPDSIIFTDEQGRLLLNYYLCGSAMLRFYVGPPEFREPPCPGNRLVVLSEWTFTEETFRERLHDLRRTYNLGSGTAIWLFQGGWYIDKATGLRADFASSGCNTPHEYGKSILICPAVLAPDQALSTTRDGRQKATQ
jgi:uncharacterized membrane protein